MDAFQMRKQVKEAYAASDDWKKKVENMGDKQLYAVWNNLVKRGKIQKPKKVFEPFYEG